MASTQARSARIRTVTINIAMPDAMRGFVLDRVERGTFGNVSEYFRHLVREDQRREADERLEVLLAQGMASGKPIPADAAFWAKRRRELTGKSSAAASKVMAEERTASQAARRRKSA